MPQRAFSDISNGKDSLLIANRGLPEVAVLPTANDCHEVALTLLRCVGFLSREDLSTRRGHAGPDMSTPAAQMPGRHAFDYAILPHSASEAVSAYHQAYAFNTAFRSARTALHPGPLPPSGSLIEVTPDEFVVSAVKISEDGSGLVVRGYNISPQSLTVTIKPWKKFNKADRVNLLETDQASLLIGEQGEVTFQAAAFQVASIKFS
jgi:alpha-mannosidase